MKADGGGHACGYSSRQRTDGILNIVQVGVARPSAQFLDPVVIVAVQLEGAQLLFTAGCGDKGVLGQNYLIMWNFGLLTPNAKGDQ